MRKISIMKLTNLYTLSDKKKGVNIHFDNYFLFKIRMANMCLKGLRKAQGTLFGVGARHQSAKFYTFLPFKKDELLQSRSNSSFKLDFGSLVHHLYVFLL